MPADKKFLMKFFLDCQESMRTRMQIEYKLLRMFIILNPVIIAALLE